MLDNGYHIDSSPDFLDFEFISIGPKGAITKVVHYREINVKGIFNLGFGDKEPVSGFISDLSISNNNDSQKVLATVARTLYLFSNYYPDAIIIASGSTAAQQDFIEWALLTILQLLNRIFIFLGSRTQIGNNFVKA
jgi:hypothetical protein